jgi:hypothetical protein
MVFDAYTYNEQLAWLDQDLEDSSATWKIVVMHEPMYTVGGYRADGALVKDLGALFDKHQVPLVFSGHDHSYQRTWRINNGTLQKSDTGTVQLLSGGASNFFGRNRYPDWNIIYEETNHFMRVEADGDTLTFKAVNPNGVVLESWSLSTVGQPVTIPVEHEPDPENPNPGEPEPGDPTPPENGTAGVFHWNGTGAWLSPTRWALIEGDDLGSDGIPGAGETGIVSSGECQTTGETFAGKLVVMPGGTINISKTNGHTSNLRLAGGNILNTTDGGTVFGGTVFFEPETTSKFVTTHNGGKGSLSLTGDVSGTGTIEIDGNPNGGLLFGGGYHTFSGTIDVKTGYLSFAPGSVAHMPSATANVFAGGRLVLDMNNADSPAELGSVNLHNGSFISRGSRDSGYKGAFDAEINILGTVSVLYLQKNFHVDLWGPIKGQPNATLTIGENNEGKDISGTVFRLRSKDSNFSGSYRVINGLTLQTYDEGVLGSVAVKLDLAAGSKLSLANAATVSELILGGENLPPGVYNYATHAAYFTSSSKAVTVAALPPSGTVLRTL